jgi:superfamily II DNA or RNA helicase
MSEPVMSPWPHQIAARDAVFAEFDRGINSTLVVIPTGGGKSYVAGLCIEEMIERGGSTLFIAQRDVLIDQAVKLFSRMGLEVIIEKAAEKGYENFKPYDKPDVVVASMQTLHDERLAKWNKKSFELIIVDEAHHSLSEGHLRIFDYFAEAKLLGITATPIRGDEKNLGSLFQTKVYEYRIAEAIRDGYLVRPIRRLCPITVDLRGIKTVGGDFSLGDLEEKIAPKIEVLARAFVQEIGQRKAVAFLPCVGSSMAFANCLELLGVTARYVTCERGEYGMRRDNKEKNLTDFEKDDYQVICCNRMLIEGWDHKKLEAVGILCPTKMWHVVAQMIGRGLRICPEISKENCLVIDFNWQTDLGAHFLSTTVQLFNDGSLDDEVLKIAEGIVKRKEAKNEDVDPMEIIEEAKEIFHRKPRFLVQLTGKSEEYKVIESDPVGISTMLGVRLNPGYDILTSYVDPPSQKQINYLRTLGMSRPEMLSKWGASKMIDKLVRRRDKGLASPKQMRELIKTGLAPEHVRDFTRGEASKALTSKKTQRVLFDQE